LSNSLSVQRRKFALQHVREALWVLRKEERNDTYKLLEKIQAKLETAVKEQ